MLAVAGTCRNNDHLNGLSETADMTARIFGGLVTPGTMIWFGSALVTT
jgi:hypothetical protein